VNPTNVVLCLTLALAAEPADEKSAVPLYTNEDLERVRPQRDRTGVASQPAASADAPPEPAAQPAKGRGEAYWRREAERLADRLRPLRSRAADLRRRIDERWGDPKVRTLSDPRIAAWERELAETQATMRELEARLEERARREGALPGWLR
jgi:hypothetical protein